MKRFESGKRYALRYKSKPKSVVAGEVEVLETEYFDKPKEISDNDTLSGIYNVGKAKIKYIGTRYYKDKVFWVDIVGYYKSDLTCLDLDKKIYFSVFLD